MAPATVLKKMARTCVPQPIRTTTRQQIARFRYRGSSFQCPMCNAWLDQLLPHGHDHPVLKQLDIVGGGHRDAATCPVCLATDRERLVYLYLKLKARLFETDPVRLLHVAPEASLLHVLMRNKNIDYLSADLQAPHVMMPMDLCDIPLGDNTFDVILCNHVLEHIADDQQAMRELCRVLKPSGFAILQTPISRKLDKTYEDQSITDPEGRAREYGQWDHVRVYGADYRQRLSDAGFYVEHFDWIDDGDFAFHSEMTHGLNPDEVLHIARKLY